MSFALTPMPWALSSPARPSAARANPVVDGDGDPSAASRVKAPSPERGYPYLARSPKASRCTARKLSSWARSERRRPATATGCIGMPGARARRNRPRPHPPGRPDHAVRPDAPRHADDLQADPAGAGPRDRGRPVHAPGRHQPPQVGPGPLPRRRRPGWRAEALNERGTLHRVTGDLVQAEGCHREALDLARAVAGPWDEAHALAGLGRCALAASHATQAAASCARPWKSSSASAPPRPTKSPANWPPSPRPGHPPNP
jgi:hypothetical protein